MTLFLNSDLKQKKMRIPFPFSLVPSKILATNDALTSLGLIGVNLLKDKL